MPFFPQSLACRRPSFALLAIVGTALIAHPIAKAAEEEPPGLSEPTQEALAKLKPLLDAKNWDASVALLNGLLPTVPPESFDRADLLDMKAKILLQKSDYSGAMEPMEGALQIADKHHNYFTPKQTLDLVYYLAQLYYQDAAVAGRSKDAQQQDLQKSEVYLDRWLKTSNKPDPDIASFYAGILYNQAVSAGEKPDQELIEKAQKQTQSALLMSIHPKESLYVLLLATYQQQNQLEKAAEVLELLVKQAPSNKGYWAQLMGLYLNLASANEKDEIKSRKFFTRAILAIERGQALGFMNTPKDNYNLVTIYYNIGQFGKATELLYAGLKSGGIESDIKNWELLAYSYQQINKGFDAIKALKEAQADPRFANNGQLDFQIGQIYSEMERSADALPYYEAAVRKEGVEKPHSVYMMLAYTAYEVGNFDVALKAVERALKFPETSKDKQALHLRTAILDAIKEHQNAEPDSTTPAQTKAAASKSL